MKGFGHGKSSLTRKDAVYLLRFLKVCYDEGARDAYKDDDDVHCRHFVADHKRELYYGTLDCDRMDWDCYQFTLLLYARNNRMPKFGKDVLFDMTDRSGIPLLCQRFYLQGVSDFVETRDKLKVDMFRDDIWDYWTAGMRGRADSGKVMTLIQEYCLEMKEVFLQNGRNKNASWIMQEGHNIWLLTRPMGF